MKESYEIPEPLQHRLRPLQQQATKARERVQLLRGALYEAELERQLAETTAVAAANLAIAAMELPDGKQYTLTADTKYFVWEGDN